MIKSHNIAYKSKQIVEYYSRHRQTWGELYPSEQWVFDRIASEKGDMLDLLDVGCACGGLASALSERFSLRSYTGVDIHQEAIAWARTERRLLIPTTFIAGDIVQLPPGKPYDVVVSLSCADWNIETERIIAACWERVRAGGYFVISLRLTTEKGINDIKRSYQLIQFGETESEPEIANYVVFNFKDALLMLRALTPQPELIGAYGYRGKPSPTAVTPCKELVFAVFFVRKGTGTETPSIKAELHLPLEMFLQDQ
jgi:SAM-dependent methyltransferase